MITLSMTIESEVETEATKKPLYASVLKQVTQVPTETRNETRRGPVPFAGVWNLSL